MVFASNARDHYLSHMILKKVSATNIFQCMKLCENYLGVCQSFSMNEATGECFVNAIKRREASTDKFVFRQGFTYYELM